MVLVTHLSCEFDIFPVPGHVSSKGTRVLTDEAGFTGSPGGPVVKDHLPT